jgi:hypothetical protein
MMPEVALLRSKTVILVLPEYSHAGSDGICSDYDEDCRGVEDWATCWKHDQERGICPFLD